MKNGTASVGSPLGDVSEVLSSGGLRLPVWVWVVAWHVVGISGALGFHHHRHGKLNGWHTALAAFLITNLLITAWELALYFRIADLERWHEAGSYFKDATELWSVRASLRDVFSTRLWALVWLAYCQFDSSYANRKSYGFTIDVGNGFVTPVPTALFLVGMTVPIFSPMVLGILGVVLFYQKFYGTVLYFFQFVFNRRYLGHRPLALVGNVGATNGVWIVLPVIGFVVSVRLILENSFALLWN